MRVVSLILMEAGSDWPGHVGGCDDVIVLTAEEDLLAITAQKVEDLRLRGHRLRVAVLACGRASDATAAERRLAVADVAYSALAESRGRLVLSAPRNASLHLQGELLGLAEELRLRGRGGARVTVSLLDREGSELRRTARRPGAWVRRDSRSTSESAAFGRAGRGPNTLRFPRVG